MTLYRHKSFILKYFQLDSTYCLILIYYIRTFSLTSCSLLTSVISSRFNWI